MNIRKMEKKELLEKIDEVKAQIKTNSKDAHFADKLIGDLLSLKGQLEHQPTLIHVPLDSVIDKLEGDTFVLSLTKDGKAVYHLKSGYTIVVDNRIESLYGALQSYVLNQEKVAGLSEEEKSNYDLDLSASMYILSLPIFAFGDMAFKFETATNLIKHLQKLQESYLDNVELQEETPEQNKSFENATIALETLKDDIDKR